jgi:N-acetylglucosamine malate deacetylase 1
VTNASPQSVLVLAPHPDDESFGCGGTVRLLTSSGGQVDVVYLTRGELGAENVESTTLGDQERLAVQRSDEGRQACRVLGVSGVQFLAGRDGHLRSQPELAAEILRILADGQYRSVFCPWPLESHRDHAATFDMLVAALGQYPHQIEVWLYEVWTPLEPNMVIPIDSAIEAKVEAMRVHASQQG